MPRTTRHFRWVYAGGILVILVTIMLLSKIVPDAQSLRLGSRPLIQYMINRPSVAEVLARAGASKEMLVSIGTSSPLTTMFALSSKLDPAAARVARGNGSSLVVRAASVHAPSSIDFASAPDTRKVTGIARELYCGGHMSWSNVYAGLAPHDMSKHNFTLAYEPVGDHTLLVEADLSAWNNIRLSVESAVCLAYKSRRWYRAPVLNPPYGDGRLKFFKKFVRNGAVQRIRREMHLFDYYDEASFRRVIPTMNASDPLTRPNLIYTATGANTLHGPQPITKLDGEQYTHIVFKGGSVQTRLLEQYAGSTVFQPHSFYMGLIESALRLRQDIICRAIRRLETHGLQPHAYVAMHMRRGDFDISYNKGVVDVRHDKVAAFVKDVVRQQTVLVITDTYDHDLIADLYSIGQAARVVCWANITREGDEHAFNAQIDMLSAVPASKFIASPLSTFSTGIVRWRKQAGTHNVGDPIYFVRSFAYGYSGGWNSPGARGTWRRM